MPSKQVVARTGEEIAVSFLKRKGYQILERNWRSKQWGEIDVIATENGQLVFVEVKTRIGDRFGYPEEAIDERKLHALKRAGRFYQESHPSTPEALRIDVIAVILHPDLSPKDIQLFLV